MIYKQTLILLFLSLTSTYTAQSEIDMSLLKIEMSNFEKEKLSTSVNDLFTQISLGEVDEELVLEKRQGLSISTFNSLKNMAKLKRTDSVEVYSKQMINCHEIGNYGYLLSLSYSKINQNNQSEIKSIISFVAEKHGDTYKFSIPLAYRTRYWKSKVIGQVQYYFRGELNETRAELFNEKNNYIADRMSQNPDSFTFFMCDNYQELNRLLGFDFESYNNGRIRDGYGVDSGCIFSIQNNEDFSHDVFHHYSSKVNNRSARNWVAEEGIAYWWGNAYYTDPKGNMITQDKLEKELQTYLQEHPDANLWDLFVENKKDYSVYANEVKMRSLISGIICQEVDRKYGQEGLNKLITAGAKERMKKYMVEVEALLGITQENFDSRVRELLFSN